MRKVGLLGVGAGLAAAAAVVGYRQMAGSGKTRQVAAVTVNGPPDQVATRWEVAALRPAFRAAPGGRGTEVSVEVERRRHGDVLEQLRRFKQRYEAGELARSDATIEGNGLPQPPARPREREEVAA
jgi:hypothetical protein